MPAGFLELSQDDQLILIKSSFFDVWLSHASRLVSPVDGTVTFSDGQYIGRQHLDIMFNVSGAGVPSQAAGVIVGSDVIGDEAS